MRTTSGALLLVTSACSSPPPPPSTPSPAVEPPRTEPRVETPAPARVATIRYAPGIARYHLTSDATIVVVDSVRAPAAAPKLDGQQRTTSESWITLTARPSGVLYLADITIDSVKVPARSPLMGTGLPRLTFPLLASARTSAAGGTTVVMDSTRCASESRAIIDPAFELTPRLPRTVSTSMTWSDTLVMQTCRLNVPVQVRRVRDFTLGGTDMRGLIASYVGSLVIDGTVTDRGTPVTLHATGAERGRVTFDSLGTGVRADTSERTLELTVRIGGQARVLRQEGRVSVERVPE